MNWIRLGFWPRILLDATIPLIILFAFGAPLVEAINSVIPAWLLSGFKTAGNMLPAIGFAILLRSMNIKGNFQYVIIGFVLYAYLGIGALGAALCGCGAGHDRIPEQRPHCRSPEYGRCW